MRRAFLLLGLVIFLTLVSGCGPYPPPTRPAASARELPPVRPDKALVIFMFPPCARYTGPAANDEEKMLCRKRRRNRIRVVESDGRLVTDFGVDQYGASYEEPGRHVYGTYHHFDHCTWDRTDCVAALKATLQPGQVYIVTFRWSYTLTSGGKSLGLVYGRLEVTPVSAGREAIFRERLAELDRVEIIPGAERGRFGELRSTRHPSAASRLAAERYAVRTTFATDHVSVAPWPSERSQRNLSCARRAGGSKGASPPRRSTSASRSLTRATGTARSSLRSARVSGSRCRG